MVEARIVAIEYALPTRVVTNAELAARHPEWQMDQVVLRTGVESRNWCLPEETALDLAETACRKLFEFTGLKQEVIDVILFCTQSPDYIMPPNANLLQDRLGLDKNIAAIDIPLACSGFIHGLYLAKALIVSRMARHVLLVTSETYSKLMHTDDRGPATLFGDGAAATWITSGKQGITNFVLGSDGGNYACFSIPAGGARTPHSPDTAKMIKDQYGNIRSAEQIFMNGAIVLDFVKREIPAAIHTLLKKAKLTIADLDLVIFHQASKLSLDFLNHTLKIPKEKQFNNLAYRGNTVSASIPIAIHDAEEQGLLRPGMKLMAVGFGVGLSWGACIIDWNKE